MSSTLHPDELSLFQQYWLASFPLWNRFNYDHWIVKGSHCSYYLIFLLLSIIYYRMLAGRVDFKFHCILCPRIGIIFTLLCHLSVCLLHLVLIVWLPLDCRDYASRNRIWSYPLLLGTSASPSVLSSLFQPLFGSRYIWCINFSFFFLHLCCRLSLGILTHCWFSVLLAVSL